MTMLQSNPKYRFNFWIEWCSGYLWAADDYTCSVFGCGSHENRVPMSDALRKRGDELAEWFQTFLNWDYPPDPGLWRQDECDRFKVAARAFFEDLKAELGEDYELIYTQDEPDEDPDLDKYLADPDFKRKTIPRTDED
jgi:hypothetical protein